MSTKVTGRKCKRNRQKKMRGDRKGESNDTLDIPGRKVTSRIPSLPFAFWGNEHYFVFISKYQ